MARGTRRGRRGAVRPRWPAPSPRTSACGSMYALIEALHLEHIEHARRHELTPVLFATAADGDPVARALVDRLADEVASMAIVALTRLDLLDEETPVLLGGGVLAARHPQLDDRIRELLADARPQGRTPRRHRSAGPGSRPPRTRPRGCPGPGARPRAGVLREGLSAPGTEQFGLAYSWAGVVRDLRRAAIRARPCCNRNKIASRPVRMSVPAAILAAVYLCPRFLAPGRR